MFPSIFQRVVGMTVMALDENNEMTKSIAERFQKLK
jgi:hypothetical protein